MIFAKRNITLLLFIISCIFLVNTNLYAGNIVILKSKDIPQYNKAIDGFLDTLGKGHNIKKLIVTDYDENSIRLKEDIYNISPNLILAVGTEAVRYSLGRINDIPILYCMVMQPEKLGVFKFNNLYGVSLDIGYKNYFDIMKEIMPDLKSVGILYNAKYNRNNVAKIKKIASQRNISVITEEVKSPQEISPQFKAIIDKIDFFWVLPDATVCSQYAIKHILVNSMKQSVPVVGISKEYVKAGAMAALAINYYRIGAETANIAQKILNNETASLNTKHFSPEKYDIILNLYIAKLCSLDIPKSLIKRAKEVIK